MMKEQLSVSEHGFSMVELMVTLAIIGILFSTAVPNYRQFKLRAQNNVAYTDYRNLKVAVLGETLSDNSVRRYRIRRTDGPAALTEPLSEVRLSKDVRLYNLRKRTRRARRGRPETEVIRFTIGHLSSNIRYRYTQVGDTIVEQVITR